MRDTLSDLLVLLGFGTFIHSIAVMVVLAFHDIPGPVILEPIMYAIAGVIALVLGAVLRHGG